jgi:parallel beta-helix repeat protein
LAAVLGVASSLARSGLLVKNLSDLRRTVAPSHSSSANPLRFARALAKYGFLSEAVDTLHRIIRLHSASASAYQSLGDALKDQGSLEESLAAYNTALDLAGCPSLSLALARARVLRWLRRHHEACAAYQTAIQLREAAGGHAYGEEVYLELGNVWQHLGNQQKAADAFAGWIESAYLADHRDGTIYCWIPKNACTFLKTAMVLNSSSAETFRASHQDAHVFTRQPNSGFHLAEVTHLEDPRYFAFTVLRDPFERLASAFANLFVQPMRHAPAATDGVREVILHVYHKKQTAPDFARSVTFDEFIHYIADTDDIDLNYHWRPQCTFFSRDLSNFHFIGNFENMGDVIRTLGERRGWNFGELRAVNTTDYSGSLGNKPFHNILPAELAELPHFPTANRLFTPELRLLVAKRFARDFELYNRCFGLDLSQAFSVNVEDSPSRRSAMSSMDRRQQAADQPTAPPAGPDFPIARAAASSEGPFDLTLPVSSEQPRDFEEKLAAAFAAQAEGKSARLVLAAGIYRSSVSFACRDKTSAVVVIEAESSGTAVFSGSDPLGGWRPEGKFWSAPWPYRLGLASAPSACGDPYLETPELMLRREILLVDGVLLRQALHHGDLGPGSFYVDERQARVLLAPPVGVDPCSALVEVATRSVALRINNASNVVIKGLVFKHDASFHAAPRCAPLQLENCDDVLIENCVFSENNNKGLYLGGTRNSNVVIRRSRFIRNGCIGLSAVRCCNLLLEDCQTNLNNWRGAAAGLYRGWPCGFKISQSVGVTVRRHQSVRNLATGGWIDLNNRDICIEDSLFYGNFRGLHLEAGSGPFLVRRCQVIGNRQEPTIHEWRWAFGSGIVLTHVSDVTLQENVIADNDLAQVGVRDDREVRVWLDPDSGQREEWHTERLRLVANTIISSRLRPTLLHLPDESFDAGRFWKAFYSHNNTYVGAMGSKDFLIGATKPSTARNSKDGEFPPQAGALDFAEWLDYSGQDVSSAYLPADTCRLE